MVKFSYSYPRFLGRFVWLAGLLLFSLPSSAQLLATSDIVVKSPRSIAQEQDINVLIDALQKQYNASFLYEKSLLANQRTTVMLDPEQNLETNLKRILWVSELTFEKIAERTFVIVKRTDGVQRINSLPVHLGSIAAFSEEGRYRSSDLAKATPKTRIKSATAVDQEISGTITDGETNEPLPGVNVVAKGTTIGTITDIDGNYTLSVSDDTEVLVYSSVGYGLKEETINGRTTINVALAADVTELGEVVVTALGIEKDSKTLGYATATVDPEELTVNRTPNVMNSLQGKVAGVNISGLGTGPGGTSKIRIRGQSSISGQNNPLIVINGVPMDNTNFGTNPGGNDANSLGPNGGGLTSDGGDGLSSINPDDIESMTVLKGATAAALYGSRAKDGVIMITTKKGGDGDGIGVTYNLNYTNESPLDFTDYQYQYGQGGKRRAPHRPQPYLRAVVVRRAFSAGHDSGTFRWHRVALRTGARPGRQVLSKWPERNEYDIPII